MSVLGHRTNVLRTALNRLTFNIPQPFLSFCRTKATYTKTFFGLTFTRKQFTQLLDREVLQNLQKFSYSIR